jgi:predicted RNA-binding Zn ribbon-like protein
MCYSWLQEMPSPMKFIGERPCLDFVNTVGGWTDKVIDDKLASYGDLVRWAELAGVVSASRARELVHVANRRKHGASEVLKRAIALRRAIRGIFQAVLEKREPKSSDTAALGRELAIARARQRLRHRGGNFHWAWHDAGHALDSMLWAVCTSAAELLTSPDLSRVRECDGENCGWMFFDNSRNHSRHWCDMQDCGNRAKVKRFRQRHQDR